MKRILVEVAKSTGELLFKNFGRKNVARMLKAKTARDYSIIADMLAEKNILKRLREAGVRCRVITEESGKIDLGGSEKVLFIDPLDGTLNYSNGIPHFCVSIALQEAGEIALGIVYDPCRRELFFAEKNKGAFLNGKRIRVSRNEDLRNSFCAVAFDYQDFKRSMQIEERVRRAVRRVRVFGSAGLDFSWVACGRLDGYVDIDLKPWDMAAGALLVEEAGGKVTDLKGNGWQPYCKEIVATNGAIHKKLLKRLANKIC